MKEKSKWHHVYDKLPDRNTKYAARYGVSVLVFDEQEHRDAGYHLTEMSFMFEEQKFMQLGSSPKGSEWIHAFWVSHWREMPDIPELPEKQDPKYALFETVK